MVQQVHLQNGFFRAHGLDGEVLLADNLEFGFFRNLRLGSQGGRIKGALTQALFQAGLVFADLAVDIFLRIINGRAHISVPVFFLRAEERISSPNGYLDDTAVVFFHRKGDISLRFGFEIAVQLGDFLLRVFLDGIAQLDFLGGKCELHTIDSFRLR